MELLRFEQFRAVNEAVDLETLLHKNYPDFVRALKGQSLDDRVMAAITAGREDGRPDDERIDFPRATTSIMVSDLRPTQSEIDVDKSLIKTLAGSDARQLRSMANGDTIELGAPVLTLNGQWVIDGHHRWSQVYAMNRDAKIVCLDLRTKEKADPVEVLKAMQMAILATLKTIPTEVVRGHNLLRVGERELKSYVKDRAAENFLAAIEMDADGAADMIWANVSDMQRVARPAANAPDREVMPQTGEAIRREEFQSSLRSGIINFKDPV